MSTFLMAKKHRGDWELPFAHTECMGNHEAIVVFTSRRRATDYLRHNRLEDQYQVSEMSAIDFISVMLAAQENGVLFAAINPERRALPAVARKHALSIDTKVEEFAGALARDMLQTEPEHTIHSTGV